MAFSTFEITFIDDFTNDENLEWAYKQGANTTLINYVCKTTPSLPREFAEGTPTGTPGETSAINYTTAFTNDDVPNGLFTINRVGNVVTITATQIDITFSDFFETQGNATVVITNTDFTETIRVRSPYFINTPTNAGAIDPISSELKLYVWNGDKTTDEPATPTYTLTAEATNFGDDGIYFEVSELIRDYIEHEYDPTTKQAAWVKYDITTTYDSGTLNEVKTLLAVDGYNYFKDGINYQGEQVNGFFEDALMFSNNEIYVEAETILRIPYLRNSTSLIEIYLDGNLEDTFNPASTDLTSEVIDYLEHDMLSASDVDQVRITNGNTGTVTTIDVIRKEECKYNPIKCRFINKFGALQEIDFMKANRESISTKKEEYRANLLTSNNGAIGYNVQKHQYNNFNASGKKTIQLNSGYISEEYNKVFEELLMSNDIWLNIEGVVCPVNIKTSSLQYKTRINDKLIAYTIDFDYSFDVINNVRQ